MPRAALRTLELLFPARSENQFSIVDLGCLEGGYSALFAQAGFSVLGLEGRQGNVDRCAFGAGRLGYPDLRFVCDDVHNLERYGSFDATFCCGLLYHLDDPMSFIRTMARCTRRALILNTHFATESRPAQFPGLSELTTHEGVLGRWYTEPGYSGEPEESLHPWTSIGNERSFWVEKRHLQQALIDAGFDAVYEQVDFLNNVVTDNYIAEYGRSLFVAVQHDQRPSG
jgi:SAM-dependent methyltransferase